VRELSQGTVTAEELRASCGDEELINLSVVGRIFLSLFLFFLAGSLLSSIRSCLKF
jgi:hypothetical protein